MKKVGYYNGVIAPLEELTVPALDRSVYFGDGCYDACMYAGRKIFALEDHLDRFFNSCRLLRIECPFSREELTAELQKVIDANESEDGFLYWQMSRGTYARGHQFPADPSVKPNLMAYTTDMKLKPRNTELKLITAEDIRYYMCNVKTLNLLPNVLAFQRAVEAGCQEVVQHRGERVTECAHSNVLIIKDGCLQAPPRDNLILPGISLKILLEVAMELKIPVKEEPFTLEDMRNADEIIVSSTTKCALRAVELDGEKVGGKAPEIWEKIQSAFADRYYQETGKTWE